MGQQGLRLEIVQSIHGYHDPRSTLGCPALTDQQLCAALEDDRYA